MLADALRERIAREGPIPARDFLQAALDAYYGAGPDIGAKGDFYTASNASLFAAPIRRFVEHARDRLGEGARVVELGGGRGALAEALGATVVEPNEGLAAAQRARGLRVVPSLDALDAAPTVFVANEVLDALPVHRVLMTADGMRELRVDWRDGRFVEVPAPLPRALEPAAKRLALILEPGNAAEVCLDAGALLAQMARAAPQAIALFLDYGGDPDALYGPGRPQGTLRGFRAHRVTDAYDAPGEQDVTADVDFPFIAQLAEDAGFARAGYATQGALLADLGLVEDLADALGRGDIEAYMAGKNLLLPGGMGERFKVLCLTRGLDLDGPLRGFRGAMSL